MQQAVKDAVVFQRELAIAEEEDALEAIRAQGCEVAELTPAEHARFVTATEPMFAEAREAYSAEVMKLVSR
jgi:TRAP-type C4-dicarboxylate transport system substrate-binding protein